MLNPSLHQLLLLRGFRISISKKLIWLTILWIQQILTHSLVTVKCIILADSAVRFVSSFEMVAIWLMISVRRRIRDLNLNLTFWMRHVLIKSSIALTFCLIWTWLISTVSCSAFVNVTDRLGTNVLLSVIECSHLLPVLLHINIFTLHCHGTWRASIFIHTIAWLWAWTSLFDLWIWVFVNIIHSVMCMSLYQSWTVSTTTWSPFAWINVSVGQFTDACLFAGFLSRFWLLSGTISWSILLRALWQYDVCISILILYFGSSWLWIYFLHVLIVHAVCIVLMFFLTCL